jgi:hypothetical protein
MFGRSNNREEQDASARANTNAELRILTDKVESQQTELALLQEHTSLLQVTIHFVVIGCPRFGPDCDGCCFPSPITYGSVGAPDRDERAACGKNHGSARV